jgi:hypothetical protein
MTTKCTDPRKHLAPVMRCVLKPEHNPRARKPCDPVTHMVQEITFRRKDGRQVTQRRCILRDHHRAKAVNANRRNTPANVANAQRAAAIVNAARGGTGMSAADTTWLSGQMTRILTNVASGKPIKPWEQRLLNGV